MPRGYPPHIQKAFDELRFGPLRTLNLRESLPSADEARMRTDGWIRAKQVERAGEVLVITGRGNSSEGGVSAVRNAVLALFPSLRRRNVITGWQEHTPGSFVVTLAPMSALFEAPKRRRERDAVPAAAPQSLSALSPDTLAMLRDLAVASLTVLGVHDHERFVESEMTTKFATLSAALPAADDPEEELRLAIRHALDELNDIE
ncbi:MAG TPA: hypothetical protein VGT98_11695 [Candidatus Elarobacter sp.]|nr:hypothetical protein [Candidatus Elarobacter sp.]